MDVGKLVEKLCVHFLEDGIQEKSTDHVLSGFSRPSARPWTETKHTRMLKRLKHGVFDKLLLRKWEWFSPVDRDMSSERLQAAMARLKGSTLVETEAILCFLLVLSGENSGGQGSLDDSGVCLSEAYLSLFESLPRVEDVYSIQSALRTSQLLFECPPGTGYRGWSSQQPLDNDRAPLHTTLFGGLTRTSLSDLNTKLDLPRLSNQPAKFLHIPSHQPPTKPVKPGSNLKQHSISSCNTFPGSRVMEADPFFLFEEGDGCDLVRQWEGWQARCPYLSEVPCFSECGQLASCRMRELGDIESVDHTPKPGDVVHQLVSDFDHTLPHLLDGPVMSEGGIHQSVASLLQLMMTYCRSHLANITDGHPSDIVLMTKCHNLLPLCSFVLHLAGTVTSYPKKALGLVDGIHSLASAAQGSYFYPLLLSVLSYAMEPYFRFVEQWVFLGYIDCGVEFGIHGNQEALNRRDEEYWSSGYVMVTSCTPTFLESHAVTLLTAGKALNLLRLCNPKHPLCSGTFKPLRLRVQFDAAGLEGVHQQCLDYSKAISEQIDANEKHRQEKLQAKKDAAKEKAELQRQEALKEADRIRKAEVDGLVADKRKKQALLEELQRHMESARAAKAEEAAIEKEKDAEMMERLTHQEKLLTQREEELAAELRAELVAHYAELSREAELRQSRAEWKVKRMNLQEKRVSFLQSEERHWQESIATVDQQLEDDIHAAPPPSHVTSSAPATPTATPLKPASTLTATTEFAQPCDISHDMSRDPAGLTSPEPTRGANESEGTLITAIASLSTTATSSVDNEPQVSQIIEQSGHQCTPETSWQDPEASCEQMELVHTADIPEVERTVLPSQGDLTFSSSRSQPLLNEDECSIKTSSIHENEEGYPRLFSTRGQAPRSTIEQILYGDVEPHPQLIVSTRGHAPPSTIQRLLYPLLPRGGTDDEGDEQRERNEPFDVNDLLDYGPSSAFQDNFSNLGDPPLRDMLTSMLGPLTEDSMAVDSDFLSLYPLDALLETCIALPLITQSHLVNKALLNHFLDSRDIKTHFVAIKRFLLMEDGEFSHVISSRLCDQLNYSSSSQYLCSPSFLNPLLTFALESSLYGHLPEAQRLSFKLKHQPKLIHTHAVDALGFLELKYEVDWPCNIVITSSMIDKCNKVFQLLLQMKRASWALKTAFHHLRQSQGLEEKLIRQLQTHRHEFQHFVNIMHGYMANQLFNISWREFEVDLDNKVHSLDDLIQAHRRFVENAIFRCLLSKKAKPVMNIIQEVLSSILCFSFQSSLVSSIPHKTFRSMCDTHKKFSEATGLLIKVMDKLVTRGYQPHLEDLLLRLNFNSFYGHNHNN